MVRIPRFLSRPMAFLWFETDELAVGFFVIYMAMMTGGIETWLSALAVFLFYRSKKKTAGRGFLRHLPHILGFKTFKGFPHSFVTEFME